MAEQMVIVTEGLTKSYGNVQALRKLDLAVRQGEIFGFLGPNGAGKTTTIRCLLDMIRPTGGTASVLGMDPQRDPVAVQARTGYLPGELQLDDNMTAQEQLRYFNALRAGKANWAYVRQLADRFDLDLRRPIKNLSKGNKQKVGVIQALMHHPDLLILDEPTSGLDPLMQHAVLELLREARQSGSSVFFSSHIMSEVEGVADRVGIIRRGQLVEVAEPETLSARALHRATVRFKEAVDVHRLTGVEGVHVLNEDGGMTMQLEIAGDMDAFIAALAGLPVRSLETSRPSLEDVFLAYYKEA